MGDGAYFAEGTHVPSRLLSVVAALSATLSFVALGMGSPDAGDAAGPAPTWAPAATAKIHPGVQVFTNGAQCTANFVFTDATNAYIGQAAHCSGTGGNTATNGCTSGSLPVGTPVQVTGASKPGVMVYNSWLTMQALHEADPNTCQYNDLALVRLDPNDVANVNPSIPHWGGPTGINAAGTRVGDFVYSDGNSELRGGVTQLSPKQGVSLGDAGAGWSHTVYTVTPGIPGDSGSAFLDPTGQALGILSTVAIAPLAGSNGVGDVSREVAYLHAHSSFTTVQLVPGTVPFNSNQAPAG
ncbi:MAG: hypothetical protein QOI08_1609 [Actinomycetota bacterium]|nr:hypothetical protein [Actinomycetota bacterium]